MLAENLFRSVLRTIIVTAVCLAYADVAKSEAAVSDALRVEALAKLREVMSTQQRWVKVHAAEALVDAGNSGRVQKEFERELAAHRTEPEYRIGIWRVLARAARAGKTPQSDAKWVKLVSASFMDEASPDRVHAAETLAKLQTTLSAQELAAAKAGASVKDPRLAAYCRWLLVVGDSANRDAHLKSLLELLHSPWLESRGIAAYALRFLGARSPAEWEDIHQCWATETDPFIKLRLGGALLVAAPKQAFRDSVRSIRDASQDAALKEGGKFQMEWVAILAEVGDGGDVDMLVRFLRAKGPESPDQSASATMADLQAAAANAVLKIDRRGRR